MTAFKLPAAARQRGRQFNRTVKVFSKDRVLDFPGPASHMVMVMGIWSGRRLRLRDHLGPGRGPISLPYRIVG
jgi:hypothetical protein